MIGLKLHPIMKPKNTFLIKTLLCLTKADSSDIAFTGRSPGETSSGKCESRLEGGQPPCSSEASQQAGEHHLQAGQQEGDKEWFVTLSGKVYKKKCCKNIPSCKTQKLII